MKTLKIDEKWSVEYDDENNDRPVNILRHGSVFEPAWDESNFVTAMFYALLAAKQNNEDIRKIHELLTEVLK